MRPIKTKSSLLLIPLSLACFGPLAVAATGSTSKTSDVNVVNTPTVNVLNTPTVKDVDSPARQPFQTGAGLHMDQGMGETTFNLTAVPAGKRLVIDYVSVFGVVPTGQKMVTAAILLIQPDLSFLQSYFRISSQGPCGISSGFGDCFVASDQVRLYADPGTTVRAYTQRDDASGAGQVTFFVSGYFVNLP
jgi:hypothetical protein